MAIKNLISLELARIPNRIIHNLLVGVPLIIFKYVKVP